MFNVTLHLFFYYFQPLLVISFFSWMIFLVHIRFLFFFSSQMDDMGRCQILGSHCTLVVLFISKCVGNFLNQSDWQNIFFYLWERFSPIYLKHYCQWELGCFLYVHVIPIFEISIRDLKSSRLNYPTHFKFRIKLLWNHWNVKTSSIWWEIFFFIWPSQSNFKL